MIKISHLVKKYGDHVAVDDLSLEIESGRIYGFLGPNGAGKSTTMNIITGYIGATKGEVSIDGHDIFEEPIEAKKNIGYLPELPPLYMDMTVLEYLKFVAELKLIPKSEREDAIEQAMEKTGLLDMRRRLIRNLSKGYKQRVGIAQAIINMPKVVILDEPTVGLDPAQIIEIRELIKSLGKEHTVILSSHILSEVAAVCDHVFIISGGKLVASDSPEALEKNIGGGHSIHVVTKGEEDKIREELSLIEAVSDMVFTRADDDTLVMDITVMGDEDVRESISLALSKCRMPVLEMNVEKKSLEDVFLALTTDDTKEEINVFGL